MSATRSASCGTSTECLPGRGRTGFTLVELLWAMTLSLVVMGAVASLFGVFTRSLKQAQAAADISARMRAGAWRLRQDLSGVTVDLLPPVQPEAESGYFEYTEGPCRDAHAKNGYGGWGLVGDVDDVLMFTTRSDGQPFVGRFGNDTIESPVAEVAWFCRPSSVQPLGNVTLFTLYRRQELVVPYVGRSPFMSANSAATFDANLNDLSVRLEGGRFVPNSLGDLTKRENRFLRGGTTAFPHAWGASGSTTIITGTLSGSRPAGAVVSGTLSRTFQLVPAGATLSGAREWEDVILSNVLSFDVRAFDPDARPGSGASFRVVASAGSSQVQGFFPRAGVDTSPMFAVDLDVFGNELQRVGNPYSSPLLGSGTIVASNFFAGTWPIPPTLTLSAPATASGTTLLTFTGRVHQPGDPYWGGPGFIAASGSWRAGGYADLNWGGETLMPLQPYCYNAYRIAEASTAGLLWRAGINDILMPSFAPRASGSVGAAFPPAGQTAFQSGGVRVRSGTTATVLDGGLSRTYDTWSTHYESNGVDEDGDGKVDNGTNGNDDNNDGVPDDPAEAETSPPYPARLRGLEIRIRCYEPESGQIRQTTLRHTFLAR